MSKAIVYIGNVKVGLIYKDDEGYHFQYFEDYLKAPLEGAISLNLPLQVEAFHSKILFAFFDGLIPEGWLLNLTSKNWKLDPSDRFSILMKACTDCIGNVSVREVNDEL